MWFQRERVQPCIKSLVCICQKKRQLQFENNLKIVMQLMEFDKNLEIVLLLFVFLAWSSFKLFDCVFHREGAFHWIKHEPRHLTGKYRKSIGLRVYVCDTNDQWWWWWCPPPYPPPPQPPWWWWWCPQPPPHPGPQIPGPNMGGPPIKLFSTKTGGPIMPGIIPPYMPIPIPIPMPPQVHIPTGQPHIKKLILNIYI